MFFFARNHWSCRTKLSTRRSTTTVFSSLGRASFLTLTAYSRSSNCRPSYESLRQNRRMEAPTKTTVYSSCCDLTIICSSHDAALCTAVMVMCPGRGGIGPSSGTLPSHVTGKVLKEPHFGHRTIQVPKFRNDDIITPIFIITTHHCIIPA